MNSKDILYSKGQNDECYTPKYVVEEIVKYIPKDKIIWCPFDEVSGSLLSECKSCHSKCLWHMKRSIKLYIYCGCNLINIVSIGNEENHRLKKYQFPLGKILILFLRKFHSFYINL